MAAMHYRPEIDGLRAVAVLLVVGYHAFPEFVPGGFVGVDIFFVISGYLISRILLIGINTGMFSISHFYERRVRRLLPTLLLVLIAVILCGWIWLLPVDFLQLGKQVAAATIFIPNFAFWSEINYFNASAISKPLLHLWSLGVEEQFYLVWPFILSTICRKNLSVQNSILCLFTISFTWNIIDSSWHPSAAYFLPASRAWKLMTGAFLADLERSRCRRPAQALPVVGLLMIAVALALIKSDSIFPGWWALLPTIGTAFIIAGGRDSIVGRILRTRPLPWIGLISYAFYLWHWPILSFVTSIDAGVYAQDVLVRFVLVGLAFVLAIVSYYLVERLFRTGRSWWQIVWLLALAAAVGGTGMLVWLKDGLPSRLPIPLQKLLTPYSFSREARRGVCWRTNDDPADYPAECHLSSRWTQGNSVLIWGDSYAARLYPGLRVALGMQANIAQLTRSSCATVIVDSAPANCNNSNIGVLDDIRLTKPQTVVLFSAWTLYANQNGLYAALRKTIAQLKALGRQRVVLLGPAPYWQPALPVVVFKAWSKTSPGGPVPLRLPTKSTRDAASRSVESRLRSLAIEMGISYFSVLDAMCNGSGCLTTTPGNESVLTSWDSGHLTTPAATFIARKMIEQGMLPQGIVPGARSR